ncbi:hypothetical protein [Streptomyces sp. NPDC029526]|uniref:hypothetical protein n=1 Tax=Streptomyces sp. NPDC029526 TaxID=3155728 RepID=UPI0033DD673F
MSDTTRRPLDEHHGTGHDLHRDTVGGDLAGAREGAPDRQAGPTGTTRPTGATGVQDGTSGLRDDAYGRTDGRTGTGTTPGDGQPSGPAATTGRTTAPAATPGAAPAPGTAPFGDGGTRTGPDTGHTPSAHGGSGGTLLPHGELDALTAQLHHAVTGFVDAPREAVEEADQVLQELTARFTEAVTERRRTLRRSWQTTDGSPEPAAAATDTEQLRLALRDYRELAERLLHV